MSKKVKGQAPASPASGKASSSAGAAKGKTRKPQDKAEKELDMLRAVGSVVVRNEFYRDGYRSILRLVVIEALIILALIGSIYFVVDVHQPKDVYFATTEDGRLIPLTDLADPNLTDPALISWAAQAATEVMTFGFNDYRRRIQESARNFTRTGWITFTAALQESRIIEMVEQKQQVVTARPTSAPLIIQQGPVRGRYQWLVQMPMAVTYQSGSSVRDDRMRIELLIVRVPKLENPNGVGIERWNAR